MNMKLTMSLMILLTLLSSCSWCEKNTVLTKKVFYSEPSPFEGYTCVSASLPDGNITTQAELMGYFAENYFIIDKYRNDCDAAKKSISEKKDRIKKMNQAEENRIKDLTK